jgi:hypothetical protein
MGFVCFALPTTHVFEALEVVQKSWIRTFFGSNTHLQLSYSTPHHWKTILVGNPFVFSYC